MPREAFRHFREGGRAQPDPRAQRLASESDQVFRHQRDRLLIRKVLFADAQLLGHWFVFTEDFTGAHTQLFQQRAEIRFGQRRLK